MANTDFAYFKDDQTHVAVLFSLAMAAHFACPWLWNGYLYPAATQISSGARLAYSLAALAACMAGLAVVGAGRRLPNFNGLVALGLACTPLGVFSTVAGIEGLGGPWMLYLGIGLFGLGRFIVFLLIGSLLSRVGSRSVVSVTTAGLLLSLLPPLLAEMAPAPLALGLAAGLEGVSALLCLMLKRSETVVPDGAGAGKGEAERTTEAGQAAFRVPASGSVEVGRPSVGKVAGRWISWNFLFAIGMFFLVFGFSGRYYDQGGPSQVSFLCSFLPLALLGLWMLLRPDNFSIDVVYRVALILTALGFVGIAFPELVSGQVANAVVMGGSHCFVVIYWAGLCSSYREAGDQGVSVLLWGRIFKSGGTLVGTFVAMGMIALGSVSSEALGLVATVIALSYMVTALVVLRSVDYLTPARRGESRIDALEALVAEYGLTPREREVMQYLVKGRSAQYIQDALVVSRNTVKSHMKHIYTKLDVHTQQELISLFEEQNAGKGK